MSDKKQGSISHSALNIQKEVAEEQGKIKGKQELHLQISTYLQECKTRGETKVSIEHLENLLTVWMSRT